MAGLLYTFVNQLLESQDISQSAFDQVECNLEQLRSQYESSAHAIKAAELNLKVMEHNLTAAEARVEEAREALSYTTIYSPIDGVITQLNAEVGEVVMTGTMNNPGTVILQVADLSTMILLAEVDETNVGQVQIGQPAKICTPLFVNVGSTTIVKITSHCQKICSRFLA
jgi:HlyD family secretion protein